MYRDEHEMDTLIDWSYYDSTISNSLTRIYEPVPEFIEQPDDPKSYSIIGEYIVPDLSFQPVQQRSLLEMENDVPSIDDSWRPPVSEPLYDLNDDDWELSIESMLLDLDCTMSTDQLQSLPDRTLFCNDSCDAFLRESSEGLTGFFKAENGELIDRYDNDSDASPDWCHQTSDPDGRNDAVIMDNLTNLTPTTYPCTFNNCCKVYAKPAHLKAHLRRHVGDKPYICTWPDCTWKFSRSDELSRHRRSHSGVKPYKCGYCTKCFARSDHLTKHRKVHERKMAKHRGTGGEATTWPQVPPGRPGRRPKSAGMVIVK